MSMLNRFSTLILGLLCAGPFPAVSAAADALKLEVYAGVACVAGGENPARAVKLAHEGYLTLALHDNAETLGRIRDAASNAGLLGRRLFTAHGAAEAIPLADRTVDLLVAEDVAESGLAPATRTEILRVLAPGRGRALLKGTTLTAPAAPDTEDWTHRLHGPDNNPVSADTGFRGDPFLQFVAAPLHTSFMGAMLMTEGIRVEVFDWVFKKEGRDPLLGKILGRQAHNGLILWIRELPKGIETDMPLIAAVGGKIYVAEGEAAAVRVLDAATGKDAGRFALADDAALRVYWLAVDQGRLTALVGPAKPTRGAFTRMIDGPNRSLRLAMGEGGTLLLGCDAASGKVLWRHEEAAPIDYRTVAVRDGITYFFSHGHRLAALGPDGKVLWENSDGAVREAMQHPSSIRNFNVEALSSLIVGPAGHLLLAYREGKRQFVFSTKDGKLLWEPKVPRGLQGAKPKWHFVGNRLHGDQLYDADTGKVLGEAAPLGGGCGLVAYAPGMEAGLSHIALGFKSPCGVGALPASGLLHFMANHCICWPYMRGAAAFASGGSVIARAAENPEHPLITQGKQPGAPLAPEWAEYRGGPERRGSARFPAPFKAGALWKTALEKPFVQEEGYNKLGFGWADIPTPPIAGAGFAWYGASDGAVRCVRLSDGAPAWTFWTGGPILTSPSVREGRLFAASFDGWVYCLDATDGRLLWKWRSAPANRLLPVFGKLVSAWPVIVVQIHQGTLYGAAGHWDSNGAVVFALDAATGQPHWTHWSRSSSLGDPADSAANPVFTSTGYLAVVGDHLVIPNSIASIPFVFNRHTGHPVEHSPEMAALRASRTWQLGVRASAPGIDLIPLKDNRILGGGVPLFNPPNLRDHHNARFVAYALADGGGVSAEPFPEVLIPKSFPAPAFDGEDILFVGGIGRKTARINYPTLGVSLWRRDAWLAPESRLADSRKGAASESVIAEPGGASRSGKGTPDALDRAGPPAAELDLGRAVWSHLDLDINAVALGPDAAYAVVGVQAQGGVAYNKHAGFKGWKLLALKRQDGSELWSVDLPGEPVFNGIAAAEGKIILTLRDGTLAAGGVASGR